MPRVLMEVCLETADDAITAEAAGADRIELNAALSLGGLSPSPGILRAVRKAVRIPIISMARPHPGGFAYADRDFAALLDDGRFALNEGAEGIAFGVLSPDGTIDARRCEQAVTALRHFLSDAQLVFHRAFDFTPDPFAAMEQLIALGFTRILTSGQQPTAAQGAELIAELIAKAAGRIEILPASGIRPENVIELVRRTACSQVHGSLSSSREDRSVGHRKDLLLSNGPDGNSHRFTSDKLVREMVAQLHQV